MEPAENPISPVPRRRSQAVNPDQGGGPPMGVVVGIAAAGVVVVGLIVIVAVMSSGSGSRVESASDRSEKQAKTDADGAAPSLLDQWTGREPVAEVSSYPQLGPLMGPLLTPPPLRNTTAHESHRRKTIQLIGRFNDLLASVQDVASLRAAAQQFQSIDDEHKADLAQFHPPFRMTPAEEALLDQRLAADDRREMERSRKEAERIAGIPGLGLAGTQLLARVARVSTPLEARLRRSEQFQPRNGPLPYAEIYIKMADEGAEAVCRQQLSALLGEFPGLQYSHSADWKRASFRVWPVEDPDEFARLITFGKVTSRNGRNIFVTANSFTAAEVASAREAFQASKLAPPANFAAPESNDPKPPADADALTKLLFDLRSSNPNKRRETVKSLARFANKPERNEEVTKELVPLLQDRDGWFVKDVMLAMLEWQTDETIPLLIKQLSSGDSLVRDESAKILGDLGDARAAEPMIKILKTNPFVVDSLRKLGSIAEPALINGLTDSDPTVRRGVCDVLEKTGGKEALLAMMQLPSDSDPLVRIKASQAMKAIQGRVGSVSPPKKGANPFVKKPSGKADRKP